MKEQRWKGKVTRAGGTKAEQKGQSWPREAAWVWLEVGLCPPQCPGGYLQPVSAQGQPPGQPTAGSAPEIPPSVSCHLALTTSSCEWALASALPTSQMAEATLPAMAVGAQSHPWGEDTGPHHCCPSSLQSPS